MLNTVKKYFGERRILIIINPYVFISAPVHFLSILKFLVIYSWPLTAFKKCRLGIIALLAIGSAKAGMSWETWRDFINENIRKKTAEAADFAHPGIYVGDQYLKSHGDFWTKIKK